MPENEGSISELEKLEELAGEFNIFKALNLQNNEIRHSTFLAWLLDPSESHGLGDYFLSLFLTSLISHWYWERKRSQQEIFLFKGFAMG